MGSTTGPTRERRDLLFERLNQLPGVSVAVKPAGAMCRARRDLGPWEQHGNHMGITWEYRIWLVVWKILIFPSGNFIIPTHIFSEGWPNHQPEIAVFAPLISSSWTLPARLYLVTCRKYVSRMGFRLQNEEALCYTTKRQPGSFCAKLFEGFSFWKCFYVDLHVVVVYVGVVGTSWCSCSKLGQEQFV